VFNVGNLSVDCTADVLKSFVSNLNVTVISCFGVKSRCRFAEEADEELLNRKGFRLCILEKDRQRLLDESVWPQSVTVCEWFSKPQTDNARRRSQVAASDVAESMPTVEAERTADVGTESIVVAAMTSDTATNGSADDTILVATDQYTNMDVVDNVTLGNDGV